MLIIQIIPQYVIIPWVWSFSFFLSFSFLIKHKNLFTHVIYFSLSLSENLQPLIPLTFLDVLRVRQHVPKTQLPLTSVSVAPLPSCSWLRCMTSRSPIMEATVPVPAPRALRAPTCSPQTSALEAEPRPSSPTRRPARSRSRPPPCAPVSLNAWDPGESWIERWNQEQVVHKWVNRSFVPLRLLIRRPKEHQTSSTAAVYSKTRLIVLS